MRKSLATAAHWLRVSALHDHARAAYDLALMHEEGRGVPRTPREAFRFMKLAAEFADWDAYHALGWYYRNGFGCGVDEAKAMMWYRRGARAGNPASAFNLAVNYAEGSKVVRRSMRMARKYWELALRRDPEWTRRRAKRYAALRPLLAAGDEVSRRVAAPLDAAAKRHEATRSAIVVRRGVSGNS